MAKKYTDQPPTPLDVSTSSIKEELPNALKELDPPDSKDEADKRAAVIKTLKDLEVKEAGLLHELAEISKQRRQLEEG
jgi:hypothetical protein